MPNTGAGSIKEFRKKVSKTYDSISTAYHESGHTIYGLLNFIKIDLVEIFENKKDKRIQGLTFYELKIEKIPSQKLYNRVNALIGFSYAGLVAEKYQFKLTSGSDKFPLFLKDGSSDDTIEASNLIRKYEIASPGAKRYEFKKKMIRSVGSILQNNWDAVTLVAHALFHKKQLSFLDLQKLLTTKTKDTKMWKQIFKKISLVYKEDSLEESLYDLSQIF